MIANNNKYVLYPFSMFKSLNKEVLFNMIYEIIDI